MTKYREILRLDSLGFSARNIALSCGISRNTVAKVLEMAEEKSISWPLDDSMTEEVLDGKLFPKESTATVKRMPDFDYIRKELLKHGVSKKPHRTGGSAAPEYSPKHKEPRTYEAVPELPMGQVQVDFGQMMLNNTKGSNTKVYAVGFVLSHSRYKYAECQSRPFTATDLVRSCHRCFNYYGGIPKEMVFDQDSIVCVNENIGDIIYCKQSSITHTFQQLDECRSFTKRVLILYKKTKPQSPLQAE